MNNDFKYMVCTRCFTYNHAPYIKDTLNGFIIQKTSFPVVFCIVDDASTDGEPVLLKQWAIDNLLLTKGYNGKGEYYGELYLGTLKENPLLTFVILLLKDNHVQNGKKNLRLKYIEQWTESVKYFATCEGDDYWICPNKLQKQVDFLEEHKDYVLCSHEYLKLEEGYLKSYRRFDKNFSYDVEAYLKYWPTQPLTIVVRKDAWPSLDIREKYSFFRDNHVFYYILQHGLGYYMADVMGVYRISNKGLWTSLNKIGKVKIDLVCFMELLKYHKDDAYLRKQCIGLYSYYVYSSMIGHTPIENVDISLFSLKDKIKVGLRISYFYFRKIFVRTK